VDIFLREGLLDDAIAAVDEAAYLASYHYDLTERVAVAAKDSHPDWVIQTGRRHAERIMNAGQSQHYVQAARWLSIARDAARAAGRGAEWRSYVDGLLERHKRRYKLVPLLKPLRS
jgi:uncharacterized Zn finger protein